MTVPLFVVLITVALLAVAAFLVLIRMAKGPTLLDRVVAVDVLLAITVCGVGVLTVATGDGTYVPILIALTLLAFISSVSVARLGPIRDHRPFDHHTDSYTAQLPKVERRKKGDG